METMAQKVWEKSKLFLKSLVIGGLVLLLLIPTFYVQQLIEEREDRQQEAIAEVSSKWASRQQITGPIVVLPYRLQEKDSVQHTPVKHFAYFLPDELTIHSTVAPQEKHRGIYKVMLYASTNRLSGSFHIDLQKLNIPESAILWQEAFVKIMVSDNKGLNDELVVNWNNKPLTLSPQTDREYLENGLTAPLALSSANDVKNLQFSTVIHLNGSEQLLFTPVGKTTTVQVQSAWPHPSFTGDVLPQNSTISQKGFSATWKSLAHTRDFPQQWKDNAYSLTDRNNDKAAHQNSFGHAAFGASLYVPVNHYQKTMRSVKYAVLCIILTFAAFFIIEISQGVSVHPFQYALIGLALILFYTLLLSFSEYIGFNAAYLIASVATIGLIGWFLKGVLSSSKLSLIMSMVLMLLYTYIFTLLQLQDYALLLGSIGLFISLGVIMSFFRKSSLPAFG